MPIELFQTKGLNFFYSFFIWKSATRKHQPRRKISRYNCKFYKKKKKKRKESVSLLRSITNRKNIDRLIHSLKKKPLHFSFLMKHLLNYKSRTQKQKQKDLLPKVLSLNLIQKKNREKNRNNRNLLKNRFWQQKRYLQKKILFPTWFSPFNRDCCWLYIL